MRAKITKVCPQRISITGKYQTLIWSETVNTFMYLSGGFQAFAAIKREFQNDKKFAV